MNVMFKSHLISLSAQSVRKLSTSTGNGTILFSYPDAVSKLRLISGFATTHACYWMGYGGYLLTSGLSFNNNGLPIFLLPEVVDSGLIDLTSPIWAGGGLALSGVLCIMAKYNANSIVGEVTLLTNNNNSGKNKNKRLLIKTYDFFGVLTSGDSFAPWNASSGPSISEFRESKGMITYLPKSDVPTYHRIIDTENGQLKDRIELLEALSYCQGSVFSNTNVFNNNDGSNYHRHHKHKVFNHHKRTRGGNKDSRTL